MKRMSNNRGILMALLLAVLMAMAAPMAASAQTSDPYLYAYDDNLYTPFLTYVLNNGDVTQVFYISPAIVQAPDAPPTFFDSESDAMAVSLDIILDTPPSISGATITDKEAYEIDTDQWFLAVEVTIPADTSFGSLSVRATNPNAVPADDAYINVSIARQEATPWSYTSVGRIETRIYDPASTAYYGATSMTVDNTDFYENPLMSFPTGLDGLFHAFYYGGISGNVQSITTDYWAGTGTYVDTMTINGVLYNGKTGVDGWQYRVYDARHNMIPLSGYVGADVIKLIAGDIVVWKFGTFDDPNLFPDPLP